VKRCVIFDLAEVLIAGLPRCEAELAPVFGISPEAVLPGLRGEVMLAYNRGELSEDEYWARTCARNGWRGDVARAKAVLRRNFERKVPGSEELLREIAPRHRVFLLSDHGREWIDHILAVHPFLGLFERRFFSFDLGGVKTEPETFRKVLAAIGAPAGECLFTDDHQPNVETARSAGLDGVVFTGAAALREELAARGLLPG
jgi:putative hydrolase of the HAD superfamily